jgi:hypothetical protein
MCKEKRINEDLEDVLDMERQVNDVIECIRSEEKFQGNTGKKVFGMVHGLQILAETWQRDSHELFDYESRHLVVQSFTMNSSCRLLRQGTDVMLVVDEDPPGGYSQEYLIRCVAFDGRYLLHPGHKKLWYVVRDLGTHTLQEGDVVKLGRFKLRVKQLNTSVCDEPVRPDLHLMSGGGDASATVARLCQEENKSCRICLLEGTGQDEDPLIEACSCRGSIQYVHLGCLRYWINGRLAISEGSSYTYLFTQLSCELCKAVYPATVASSSSPTGRIPLVPLPETKAPYIVLENMMRSSSSSEQPAAGDSSAAGAGRGVYVISLAGKKNLRLGRGHESDVRIADVSISRWHATVAFTDDGHFVIEDHNSKFGTLVAMRKPKLLDLTNSAAMPPPLTLQSGRTVFRFNSSLSDSASPVTTNNQQQ